jgi:uncharacterized membrane protein YhfC
MAVRSSVRSVDHQVKECIKKISEEDLRWLCMRFRERVGSDLADALILIQEHYGELNRVLTNTQSAESVFEIADIIDRYAQEELKRRSAYRPKKERNDG